MGFFRIGIELTSRAFTAWSSTAPYLQRRIAGTLSLAILGCFLVAGWWPFTAPPNQVFRLLDRHAVRLGATGTILSTGALQNGSCTVEMWITPGLNEDSSTLLAFYTSAGRTGISLHQSIRDLRLDNHIGSGQSQPLYLDQFFHAGDLMFLTVTSGWQGTSVYLDGVLLLNAPDFRPSTPVCTGRFVVGDSPNTDDTWQGELSGLTILGCVLSPDQVMSDFQRREDAGHPAKGCEGPQNALYYFNESEGHTILDHGSTGVDLLIPERYVIAQPEFLEFPFQSFGHDSGDYWDLLINIGGFIPFGVTFAAFLTACGSGRKAEAGAVLAGFLVSLTIEMVQVLLPTRNSDATDLVTNTLGCWSGAMLFLKGQPRLLAKLR